MLAGVITAHYGVEGSGFYGIPLDQFLPQSFQKLARSAGHILDCYLMAGYRIYIAPAVSGYEPKYQKLGVNVLFGALLIVVLGSLTGQWLGVMQN
jgi:nitric oxide reductase subunit B